MNRINLTDRSGLPEHLKDGVLKQPDRWLILTKDGRKVAELPLEDLDDLDSDSLEAWFSFQEVQGREWRIEHR